MLRQVGAQIITLAVFFVLLFAYTKVAGPLPFSVSSTSTTKSTTFDVTGEGKAEAKPDSATIQGGVSATGASEAAVQNQINSTASRISEAVKKIGIDAKDIQTANYNVNPTYDYNGGSQKATGFSGSTNLTVKVRDVNKAGQVIDAMTGAGATNVNNLGFDVTDKTSALNEARRLAVADAKKKAADAAQIAGFSLGKIVNYSEGSGGSPRPIPMLQAVGSAKTETNLEPGSNQVDLTVTLSYEIK